MPQSVGPTPKSTSYEKQRAQVSFGKRAAMHNPEEVERQWHPLLVLSQRRKPWLSKTGDNKHFYFQLAKGKFLRLTQQLTQQQTTKTPGLLSSVWNDKRFEFSHLQFSQSSK